MASNLFVMDSRVPVDPKADPADPSHPENVTKRAIMLQRQAHADGEYDIKAPIRMSPEKITYEAKPGMILPDRDLIRDADLPKPFAAGVEDKLKMFLSPKATVDDWKTGCSMIPNCKGFYYNPQLRSFVFKNASNPYPDTIKDTDTSMGGTLYIKKNTEGFDNPPTKATVSPHLLLLFLVLSIVVGSALIGCAVCFKHHWVWRIALAVGATMAFRYAASHVPGQGYAS